MVDAGVSNTLSSRSVGSSPTSRTRSRFVLNPSCALPAWPRIAPNAGRATSGRSASFVCIQGGARAILQAAVAVLDAEAPIGQGRRGRWTGQAPSSVGAILRRGVFPAFGRVRDIAIGGCAIAAKRLATRLRGSPQPSRPSLFPLCKPRRPLRFSCPGLAGSDLAAATVGHRSGCGSGVSGAAREAGPILRMLDFRLRHAGSGEPRPEQKPMASGPHHPALSGGEKALEVYRSIACHE